MNTLQSILELLVKANTVVNTKILASILENANDPVFVALVLFGEAKLPEINASLPDNPLSNESDRIFVSYDLMSNSVTYRCMQHKTRYQKWNKDVPANCAHIPLLEWDQFVQDNDDSEQSNRTVIGPVFNNILSEMRLDTWQKLSEATSLS